MIRLRAATGQHRSAFIGLGLVLAACALTLLLPLESSAISCGREYRYFSDSSYTWPVGGWGVRPSACGCTSYTWGTTSPWVRLGPSYCPEPQ